MSQLEETIRNLKFDADGLVPAVIVDADSKAVLMVAYMDQTALRETIRTGRTHFWSRSRRKHWMKGERSGHTQEVRAVFTDCDADTVLLEVRQHGAACHDGYFSCFYRRLNADGGWDVVAEKVFDPRRVYGNGP